MPTFYTVVPIHHVDLSPGTTVEFGGGLRLTAMPPWVEQQGLLSTDDREAIRFSSHAFVVSYEAAALEERDPNWTGAYPKSIQQSKYELCVLGNLTLWLIKPSPACFSVVIHAPQSDAEPVAQQVQSCSPLLCHPDDADTRITASDLDIAPGLHQGLASISPATALFTAIRATWAGLKMNMEPVRFALFWIALEALCGPEDAREITYRLSQRLGFFLGASQSEARELFLKAKKAYGFRSKIVHGRWKEDPENTTRMAETEDLLRRSLVRIMENKDLTATFSGKSRERFLDDLVFRDCGGAA